MNLCTACGEDFASVSLFDAHRVGKHAYLYDQAHPDGRRCLGTAEMNERGWTKNRWGRWSNPAMVEAVTEGQILRPS
jgi:hypothetical protein